jgi:hypothetical protein
VVLNIEDYIKEANRQLSDTNFYVEKDIDPSERHISTIKKVLDKMLRSQEIDQSTYSYVLPTLEDTRTAKFYFLPKIHKKKVTGRPIISGNGCPTERISAFVDEHIKEFVKDLPSYVKDTKDFINKIESFKPKKESILVTMDVSSLYTNIPNHEGLVATQQTLMNKYKGKVSLRNIINLMTCVLHMNNFEFNGKSYLQINGVAMGTKLAPSLANIFMGHLEKKTSSKCTKSAIIIS